MHDTIAAGLERAFAVRGFSEPSVEDLRDAVGVSLRTLYKYMPSRDAMVLAALEHRNRRYLDQIFNGLPEAPGPALDALMGRVGEWMAQEAAHGCLFHAAVAAAPGNAALRALLERHKADLAARAAQACGLTGRDLELGLILEGLTQSWSLHGTAAVGAATRLAHDLVPDTDA